MRWMLVALVMVFCGCQSYSNLFDHKVLVKGSAVEESRWPNKRALLSGDNSSLIYQTQVVGYGEDGKHVKTISVAPKYILSVYGGQLLGGNRGEWGGELVYRDKDGVIHRLLEDNVLGIVPMPFGVVVFTGLSHLGMSTGAIYMVSPGKDQLPGATLLYRLQGAPSDILWTAKDDLVFTVQPGLRTKRDFFSPASPECHLLDKSGALRTLSCTNITRQQK
ncbi:hypothetical protein GCM10007862_29960 [Dyella lipolytica]|uniref:Lipoprotein n=1 Tax=Dyella lipolytica TaxID=1867835 RepID=A0ABW8IX29_9GAMM|nr:hypothetical protein [Dyella lipolytica]GLQ47945.1 hypothetical protein GCM10007862_29960 [Dyella lipolytica]